MLVWLLCNNDNKVKYKTHHFLVALVCPAVHRKLDISFWRRCTTVIFLFMYLFSGKTVNRSQTHKIHILNNCWGVEGCLYLMKLFQTVIWEITVTTGHSLVIPSRLVFGNFKIIFSLFCINVFFFNTFQYSVANIWKQQNKREH